MRVPHPGRVPILVAVTLVFASATALLAQAAEDTTTVGTAAVTPESASDIAPEVASYASELGVTIETAEAMLVMQGRLTTFADSMRSVPGYAGFRVMTVGGAVTGQLAVTPGTRVAIPTDLPVVVVEARLAERGVGTFTAAVADDLTSAGVTDFVALTYDPFEDVVLIWRDDNAPALTDAQSTALEQRAVEILRESFAGIDARIESVPSVELVYGGLKETRPGDGCTSGFGVTKLINGVVVNGYLTAGHCYLPNDTGWSITHPNGTMTVTSYANALMGGYQDRVVFVAPGASYWVKIAPTTTVNMQATAYHIYQGATYWQWSPWSGKQRSGVIDAVNVPITQDGYTMFTFHTTANYCPDGSSGGPVWEYYPTPPGRKPVGTLEARNLTNGTCYYLALDDQLSGSGWSLL